MGGRSSCRAVADAARLAQAGGLPETERKRRCLHEARTACASTWHTHTGNGSARLLPSCSCCSTACSGRRFAGDRAQNAGVCTRQEPPAQARGTPTPGMGGRGSCRAVAAAARLAQAGGLPETERTNAGVCTRQEPPAQARGTPTPGMGGRGSCRAVPLQHGLLQRAVCWRPSANAGVCTRQKPPAQARGTSTPGMGG